jgi:hypothetical protein
MPVYHNNMTIPGPRNTRPVWFKNVAKGQFITDEEMVAAYSWLQYYKYTRCKEIWVPHGKDAQLGDLTIVIELHHNENPTPTS